jgi:hypothetical protein
MHTITEVYMKKLGLIPFIALLAIGTASAQWGGTAPQAVTISGTLQLQNGHIVVVSGSNTYFVPSLMRYTGFIEGLKEGAQISIEGHAWENYVRPAKVIISGRTYDFTTNVPEGTPFRGQGMRHHNYGRNHWGGRGPHGGNFGHRRGW